MHPSDLTQEQRAALVNDSRALYLSLWPDTPITQACLFHATALQGLAMQRHDAILMLQAGSTSWPMVRKEDDDGVCATHYSYEWEGLSSPAVHRSLVSMSLPELHVWLAHRDPDTLIDPTTGTWPDRAKAGGFTWSAVHPPEFLWGTQAELESHAADYAVVYAPEMSACQVAGKFASLEIVPTLAAALKLERRR